MEKKITIGYLIGTFLLTFFMWGSIIIANQFGLISYGTPLFMILFLIGGNAPPIIGYCILRKFKKITGFKHFLKEVFNIKQSPKMYVLIVFFIALYFGIPALMGTVLVGSPFYIGILLIPFMIIGGGLEELGWRYILQPTLEKHFPFWVATSITSVIWAVWHLPLFYMTGTSQSKWSFGVFIIMVFGLAFALAAVYHVSHSIWLCILLHAMYNAFMECWIVDQGLVVQGITTAVMVICSVVIVRYHQKKMAY